MAIVQYGGGVEEFRGSIAGNTFGRNTSGPVVRARRVPSQPMSVKQAQSLAQLSSLIASWKNLEPVYQIYWNEFASLHPRVNMFGKTTYISGCQWFCVCNSHRLLSGENLLTSPPTYSVPTAPSFDEVVPASGSLTIDYAESVPAEGYANICYTTPYNQQASSLYQSLFRFTDIMFYGDTNPRTITTQWQNAHGMAWQNGGSINAKMQLICYTIKIADCIPSLSNNIVSYVQWSV